MGVRSPSSATRLGVLVLVLVVFALLLWSRSSQPDAVERPNHAAAQGVTADMHTHTTESDGDRTAEEQIQLAGVLGLRSLWLTDHDLIRDLPRVRQLQQVFFSCLCL